ncbi:MAG: P-type DNA transfer ATPase VirB11 [Acetobacteraceae bacterium]
MLSPTLQHLLTPLQPFLGDPTTEECCIQTADECWVYAQGGFTRHEISMDAAHIEDLAHYAAAARRQDISPAFPLLSTELPGGERLQVVLPPCVQSCPAITIRKPGSFHATLDTLAAGGIFDRTVKKRAGRTAVDDELAALHAKGDWLGFLKLAARSGKTLVLCGLNAAGKTTVAKAYAREIPLSERIITIEDTAEWHDLPHPNRVALFYSHGGQGVTTVGAGELVEAALRKRIGRLLLQELRGASAYSFARALASGHPGLSTCHADSCDKAFDALAMMVKEAPSAMQRDIGEIKAWLKGLIDIVCHCSRDGDRFGISEVWMREAA